MSSILSDINLQQIVNFVTVVELQGFQAASEHLHMTQSAVSKSIGRLEETLGFSLFLKESKGSRSFREAILTEEGKYLYRYWALALNEIESAYKHISASSQNATTTLNIAYSSTNDPNLFLWPLIDQVQATNKQLNFNVDSCYRSELIHGLLQDTYDMVFVPDIEYHTINQITMNYQHVAIGNVQVIVPNCSHLWDHDTLTVEDIKNETFSIFDDGRSASPKLVFQHFFQSVNMNPETIMIHKDGYNIGTAYRTAKSLYIVDSFFHLDDSEKAKRIPLEGYYNGICCAWKKNSRKAKYIQQVIQHIPDFTDKTTGMKPFLQK